MIESILSSDINGIWNLDNLIGASCTVVSSRMAIKNRLSLADEDTYYIESIKFRISTDGKMIPLFKLSEIDDQYFTADNLCISGIKIK